MNEHGARVDDAVLAGGEATQAAALRAACAGMRAAGDGPSSAVVQLGRGPAGRVLAPERLAWLEGQYRVYLEVLDRGSCDRPAWVRITRPPARGRREASEVAEVIVDDLRTVSAACGTVARASEPMTAVIVLGGSVSHHVGGLPLAELEHAYDVRIRVLDEGSPTAPACLRIEPAVPEPVAEPGARQWPASWRSRLGHWLRQLTPS